MTITYYDTSVVDDLTEIAEENDVSFIQVYRIYKAIVSKIETARENNIQRREAEAAERNEKEADAGRLRVSGLTAREVCRRLEMPYNSRNSTWVYNAGKMLAYNDSNDGNE